MDFLVFRRANGALLLVPALFQRPLASRGRGGVRLVGRCDVEPDASSPTVAAELARLGDACITGEDARVLNAAAWGRADAPSPDARDTGVQA